MKILSLLLLTISIASSCTSRRHITQSHATTDSTWLRERDSVIQVYRVDSAGWTNMIKTLSESGVVFENDCPPCDSGIIARGYIGPQPISEAKGSAGNVTNTVTFNPNGSIASATGRIKSAKSIAESSQRMAAYWKSAYDSAARAHSLDTGTVRAEVVTKEVTKRSTFIPWWMFVIAGIGFALWFYKLIPKRPK